MRFDVDWCNEEKLELDDDGRCIRALTSDPFSVFCVYLTGDGYDKGVHTLSIKGIKTNDNDGEIKCCVGVTSIKNKEWVNKGIMGGWPEKEHEILNGVSSYFDDMHDVWYSNEILTIKLDVDNKMVYYYAETIKSEQKLIKEVKIDNAELYYFMMCPVSDPFVKYFIQ